MKTARSVLFLMLSVFFVFYGLWLAGLRVNVTASFPWAFIASARMLRARATMWLP